MSLAFYYLIGQNVTYLSASFSGSIFATVAVLIFTAGLTFFEWKALLAVVLGFISVAYIPEHKLSASTRTFSCHENTEHHHQSIVFITELVGFFCLTAAVNIDDGSWGIWLAMAFMHTLYVIASEICNRFSGRVVTAGQSEILIRYYLIYFVVLCFSDGFFMATSIIAYNRSQNLASIFILACITFAVVYLADNLEFVHKFDFIIFQKTATLQPRSMETTTAAKSSISEV